MPKGPCGASGPMDFVSEQADLTVAMLNCNNKFLLFLPVAVKAEKRRKLTHRKVLTGRLVYDLIFNLFLQIYEKSATIINKTALIMYCKFCLSSQIHLHTVSSAILVSFCV